MVSLQTIPWNEIIHHPHSFADPDGRVFSWNGHIFRGIYPPAAPFFRQLTETGILSNLVERGMLVETELTQFTSSEFSLVFRHHAIPFASYPQEWCPLMLKDAALAIVDLAIELAHDGLLLKDGHPWNILFDACKPVYVDLGSIAAQNGASVWPAYSDFCRYCLYPLILMSQGYDLMGRLLMCEEGGVRKRELFRLAPQFAFKAHMRWPVNLVLSYAEKYWTSVTNRFPKKESIAITSEDRRSSRNQQKLLHFLKQVQRLVESIPVTAFDFQKPVQDDSNVRAMNGEILNRLLMQFHPDSILDINGGNGSLAKQAASLGVSVVCFEADPKSVSHLYSDAKTKRLSILPLVMDFTKPTPARGLASHWAIAATERFQCDLVLALDLMNRPMPRSLGFETLINGLGEFSKRWLVVEAPLDPGGDRSIGILKKQFRTVTRMDAQVNGRTLLVCEKF